MDAFLSILSRWLHVASAAVLIGGLFFLRVVLPAAVAGLPDDQRESILARCARAFKMVTHSALLLLIVTGAYNTTRVWDIYKTNSKVFHALWGMHLLLGLVVMALVILALAGKTLKRSWRPLAAAAVVLVLGVVAIGSTVKWARERELNKSWAPPAKISAPAAPGR